ncbi:MAG TPA: cyclic nucleotide-binding domain-containing protein, partial [Thermoanaerobaculia bacterium]
ATRHPSPIVRSFAATRTKDSERLREMIASDEQPVADAALIALRGTPEAAALLSSSIAEVRDATRRALVESDDTASALARIRGSVMPRAIELAIRKLEDHHLRSAAASILVVAGHDALPAIAAQLERSSDLAATQRLLRICGRIGGEDAVTLVRGFLGSVWVLASAGTPRAEARVHTERSDDGRIRGAALSALVNAGYRASSDERGAIESMIRSDADEGANESSLRDGLPDRDPFVLVRSALSTEVDRARQRVMLALSLIGDAAAIERARRQLESSSRERRAYATELLDASIPPNLRRSVLPLFTTPKTTSHLEPVAALRSIAAGTTFTPWTRACAEHALEPTMQPTLEKVITLKSVDLFARTPDDVLAQLASELETIDVPAGETIIRKGELGDSLYVIASGTVRVHDADTTIATLGEREIFGELAVLDPEPRSASVTAQSAVKLYRLDRDDLFELLPDHIEIVRGIFHVLCGRLRRRT